LWVLSKLYRILFFICLSLSLKGQQISGLVNGNYAGVNAVCINPSSISASYYYLDINLISGNIFEENNIAYLAKNEYHFRRFFEKHPKYPSHIDNNSEMFFYINKDIKGKGFVNAMMYGPSAMLSYGRHSVALTTSIRSAISVNGISPEMIKFAYYGISYKPQLNLALSSKKINASGLAWGEIGLSYSYMLYNKFYSQISIGFSIKKLMGMAGIYYTNNHLDYKVVDDTLYIKKIKASYGYSLPMDYKTNKISDHNLINGNGWSYDLGITYIRKSKPTSLKPMKINKPCQQKCLDYTFKIGASLLDIGKVKFNTNARRYMFDTTNVVWSGTHAYDMDSPNNFDSIVIQYLAGSQNFLMKKNNLTIWLPSALSIQIDFHTYKNFYINLTAIKSIHFGNQYVLRPTNLSITPRFETRFFELNLPLTLYENFSPRLGLSLRFMNFTIGTEKITGFFSSYNFSGLDLYFSLKVNFLKGKCLSSINPFKKRSPCDFLAF